MPKKGNSRFREVDGLLQWTGVETPMGRVFLAWTPDGLYRSTLPGGRDEDFRAEIAGSDESPGAGGPYRRWIERYFAGRNPGEIPALAPRGTAFSRRVRSVVAAIPPGQTRSYGEVAREAGSPGAARAVGTVMAQNPFPLFVPCQRVVRSGGDLGEFGGGREMKTDLLEWDRHLRYFEVSGES